MGGRAICFTVNGHEYTVDTSGLPADITLNTYLRQYAQLTATKSMCLEGGCGTCVCVVKSKDFVTGEVRTWAVNSCLTLLNVCRGWDIVTCEGIGNKRDGYHPIQKRLAKMSGTQCGFCSPGFVMNMYALMESRGNQLTMEEIENSFGGNLCRCTGYRPILDTMKSFAVDNTIALPADCQDIEDLTLGICPKTGIKCKGACKEPLESLDFPKGEKWYWPETLEKLFDILAQIKDDEEYMLVAGNTAHGVYRRSTEIKHFIDINKIHELKQYKQEPTLLTLGANLSLTEAMEVFQIAKDIPDFEYCEQLWKHFDLIAHVPVRNAGTLAGNIFTKKKYPRFPSDVFITFEALDVQLLVNSSAEKQEKMSLMDYLKSESRKLVITAFELQAYPEEEFIFKSYKITPRAQNAHAHVNAGFLLRIEALTKEVKEARICFGGIRPDFVHATVVESVLVGNVFNDPNTVSTIFREAPAAFKPDAVLPDTSPRYRVLLACGLLYKFLLNISPSSGINPKYLSGSEVLKRPLSSGMQKFGTVVEKYPVTQPVLKLEGLIQCSGEAKYVNDILTTNDSGFCAFVTAKKVGAIIEEIDASEALKMPEVLGFFSAKDIPGKNVSFDKSFDKEDEEIFCDALVKYYDQPLGIIVARTEDAAHYAAKMVKVTYSHPTEKLFVHMQDVLENNIKERIHVARSHMESFAPLEKATVFGRNIFILGSQFHFSMEPQVTVVVPLEKELRVWCATQWMDHTQCVIANMLNMNVSDVQLEVRRVGGAFGCKISRGNQVACAASLAAYKLNRPIRFVQRIQSMMRSNGKRWACRSDYEFQALNTGKVVAIRNTFYEDAGCSLNENPIQFALDSIKNCYQFSNYEIDSNLVLTDAPSTTWFRAPGTLEGIAMIENILEHIAFEAHIDPADARLVNIRPGNKMAEILPEFLKSRGYRERRKEIIEFNEKNRWRKKGIGLAVMEYPLSYVAPIPATVAVYHVDGTVIISHGAIELGQGLNTKVVQVAAYNLGIPMEMISIEPSDTVNGANGFLTGSSLGSETICCAVTKACDILKDRLKPVRDSLDKDASWKEIIHAAHSRSINLIANDHFKLGDLENYSIYGVGLTEVEVDILTGNLLVKRVDLFEDTGESLSPIIDVGQVEGAFVMGLGYWLTEELIYDRSTGRIVNDGTWEYKPPCAKDIPIDFRIELSQKYPNQGGFMRSKATGEPAISLTVSVMFAIRQALESARKDAGLKREWIRLGAPTTVEKIALNAESNVELFSLQ